MVCLAVVQTTALLALPLMSVTILGHLRFCGIGSNDYKLVEITATDVKHTVNGRQYEAVVLPSKAPHAVTTGAGGDDDGSLSPVPHLSECKGKVAVPLEDMLGKEKGRPLPAGMVLPPYTGVSPLSQHTACDIWLTVCCAGFPWWQTSHN